MAKQPSIDRVSIRPGVSVLSVLAHLNYRPWFALAEFIDNAIQSFVEHRKAITASKKQKLLTVSIEIDTNDTGRITIRDNAAGIAAADFPRAFRPAQLPPDRTGLCEFGMGMKSAACWFARRWSVRTSALGEPTERVVRFDIAHIVRDSIEELQVESHPTAKDDHFTEIVLEDLHHIPIGRTLGKIRAHLQDIYRIFCRDGTLELRLNGEVLTYEPPDVLKAPSYRDEKGKTVLWRKDFDFDFGGGLHAVGFAAIRKVASTSGAGFALFRRKRLIQGSGDEGYRPEFIFGKPNTFPYQRVFGEIELEGFEVSHTKDGFQWDENEQPFLEFLKEEITKDALPLLQQAREYRVERAKDDFKRGATEATQRTSKAIEEHVPPVLSQLCDENEAPPPPTKLPNVDTITNRVIDLELHGKPWRIVLELSVDPSVGDWLEVSDRPNAGVQNDDGRREIGLRLSLNHPFMQRFCGTDCQDIEPLLRVAAALGLAEVAARESGTRMAGNVRRNVNELLRNALSQI